MINIIEQVEKNGRKDDHVHENNLEQSISGRYWFNTFCMI